MLCSTTAALEFSQPQKFPFVAKNAAYYTTTLSMGTKEVQDFVFMILNGMRLKSLVTEYSLRGNCWTSSAALRVSGSVCK